MFLRRVQGRVRKHQKTVSFGYFLVLSGKIFGGEIVLEKKHKIVLAFFGTIVYNNSCAEGNTSGQKNFIE